MNKKMLICGNGFSINFDSGFSNIMDRLYEAHLVLKRNSSYEVGGELNFKKRHKENYKEVFDYLKNISRQKLYNIFIEAMEFGEAILEYKELDFLLKNNNTGTKLVFDVTEKTILKSLISDYKAKGLNGINIEYITILVYFYYVLEDRMNDIGMEYNEFVKVVRIGDRNKLQVGDGTGKNMISNLMNGFTIYYKLLFSIAIFNNGKSISLEKLDRIKAVDIENIKMWLKSFDSILTLNYDKLMECLVPNKEVIHVHGCYKIGNETYRCNSQKIGFKFENEFVNCSNILVGDYIYNKISRNTINVLSRNNQNEKMSEEKYVVKIIEESIKAKNIDEITIFGMNINNDQHIIRAIMTGFYFAVEKKGKIKYCYFTEEDRILFQETYQKCMTFSSELNDYIKNKIEIEYIKTEKILQEYFKKEIVLV